jgi:sugar lactone lactonase YvrE
MTVTCLVDAQCALGEGPCWDPRDGKIWWVDILAGKVHWFEPSSGASDWLSPQVQITALGLRLDGGFIAATPAGAGIFDPQTGNFKLCYPTLDEGPDNRSNDGNVGAEGSFWFGTMHKTAARRSGTVYRVRPDWSGQVVVREWGIANTLRTSPDGRLLYLADSLDQSLFRYEITAEGLGARQVFADTLGQAATPDGSAVDLAGYVWNAQWEGWRLVRYAPDGTIERTIALPVQQPTSCSFGGPDRKTLFITSARDGLSSAALENQPQAGGLFALPVDVAGAPPLYFEG